MYWRVLGLLVTATYANEAVDEGYGEGDLYTEYAADQETRHSIAHIALDELRSIEAELLPPTISRSRSLVEYIFSLVRPATTELADPVQIHDPFAHVTATLAAAANASLPDDEVDTEALLLLADLNFYGNYTYPRNYHKALAYYRQLSELNGNMTAHEQLGFLYATGIGGVERDQGLALLHHTMASEQGSTRSTMTLGYRFMQGIGTAPNCTVACEYYASAADDAIRWIRSGPPGGRLWRRKAYSFAEELGGLYGARMKTSRKSSVSVDARNIDDVIDYFTYLAEKNDAQAAFNLAKLYREGSRTVEVDHVKALYWFRNVARTYWTKDGKTVKNAKALRYHAETASWIGQAYLRGEGTDQDFEKARIWFQRGIALGDAGCQYGMALMHMNGLGSVNEDLEKAIALLQAASDSEHYTAQLVLGQLVLDQEDFVYAARLFESAAKAGRVEAFYFLAQFHEQGIGRDKSCQLATQYYKLVAESAETLHSTIPYGNKAYREGRLEDAIIAMMLAAESGYEKGQVNVAYLLDQHRHSFSLKDSIQAFYDEQVKRLRQKIGTAPPDPVQDIQVKEEEPSLADELALLYYTRSAGQNNWESLVKAADYHLEGHGTSASPEQAVTLWQAAADSRQMPLALWNLGWSYENGVGVEQDFHLAKRYYDSCLEADRRATLAVTLSLFKLRARSAWNTMTGGSVRSIKSADKKEVAFSFSNLWTGFRHFWRSQWDLPSGEGFEAAEEDYLDEDFPSTGEDLYESLLVLAICLFIAGAVYVRTHWHNRRLEQHRDGQAAAADPAAGPPAPADPHMAAFIGGFPI